MAISVKHAFQSAKADGLDSTLVQPSSWNAEHTITAAAGVVLGRNTSGAGAIQELPIAVDVSGNVALAGALSVDGNTTLGNASTDSVTVNSASVTFANATTIAGALTFSGAVGFNGNTTLGDASTDTVTLNAGTVSIPNNVNFSGGNVGIGTSTILGRFTSERAASSAGWVIAGKSAGVANESGIYIDASNNAELVARNGSGTLTVRIASSGDSYFNGGKVGIGTSSPQKLLEVASADIPAIRLNSTASGKWKSEVIFASGANSKWSTGTDLYNDGTNNFFFFDVVANSNRMMISNLGEVLVGTVTSNGLFNGGTVNPGVGIDQAGSIIIQRNSAGNAYLSKGAGYADSNFIYFMVAGTQRGSIYYNSGTTQTVYATTSDYRAKDLLGPVENASATVNALKVYKGQMHGATMAYPMLVAHEAQEVVPFAVSGEKDAVNDDGTPKMQQMDYPILVPLLTAALQEANAKIDTLEARIAALEAA